MVFNLLMLKIPFSGGPVINSAKEVVCIAVEGATQEDGDNDVVVVSEIDAVIKTIT